MRGKTLQRRAAERALELPGSELTHPFGEDWDVYKVRGKIFMLQTAVTAEPIVVLKAAPADMIPYGVTKAAMIALGNGLAKRTRGTAVTVNTVLGGPTYSDGVASAVEAVAAAQGAPFEAVKASIIGQNHTTLLERFIEPDEVASLVLYLASPLASATNGAAVRGDGGVLTGML